MIEKVLIMGAAGRDFHNFNVYFRDNPRYHVIGFTATQIPDIDDRRYPAELAGSLYPDGVKIYPDSDLTDLIKKNKIDLVAFSYSDIPHTEVMHQASKVNAAGADFLLIGASYTMLKSSKKVISVCAVRTGCGKSQTTRKVIKILKSMGKKVVAVRHPMPYGDLIRQEVQRFASLDDIDFHQCTIEEREEYEPIVNMGAVIYAGVDYKKILNQAEEEADLIVWDGGNNDTPFFQPDLHIVVFDPHRAGHELLYHPGETNLRLADIAVINKIDSARQDDADQVKSSIKNINPKARIILAESQLIVSHPETIQGKKVLVVEDGPTLTHGEMDFGAGIIAAKRYGAAEIIDPRPYLCGTIADTFKKYPKIGTLLPAMGYGTQQIKDLEETINRSQCDLVISATPINLKHLIKLNKPLLHIDYEYKDHSQPDLETLIKEKFN